MGEKAELIEDAIRGRRSIRAFRPEPVERALVMRILDVAAWAPSGTNMQPWRVYALDGEAKDALSRRIAAEHAAPSAGHEAEYQYYPHPFFEPYLARRRKVGFDLYGAVGIVRGDAERMALQHRRNFLFFDAPVGLLFTIHRELKIGSWLDYGMFLQNIMIAARAHGLDTCAQAAFAPYHRIIRDMLPVGEDEIVVCGMSLGYADLDAPENRFPLTRVPASEFTTFISEAGR